MQQRGFSIDNIGDVALSVGIAVIVVAVVALILATFIPSTYMDVTVANTTFDNTTTLTVSHGLVSWAVYNDTTQNYLLTLDNYTLWPANGSLVVNGSAAFGGLESVAYVYSGDSNATEITSAGLAAIASFADWFAIVVIVVVAVIILTLVMLLRGRGGGRE